MSACDSATPPTVVCLASFEKGAELLRECGARCAEDFHAVLPPVTDPRAARDTHHAEEHPAP